VRPLFALVSVVLFLALAAAACLRSGVQLDDAGYVALHVADNVRHGHGIVFNPGERRDLVDSPLWLGLLTVFTASEHASLLVQFAGMILGTAVLLLVLAGPRLLVAGACASLFLGLDGLFAAGVTTGGSGLLAAAYLVAFQLHLRRARSREDEPRHADRTIAIWASVAPLVRYELALVVLPAMLGWALADWRRPRAWLPLGAAVAGCALCLGMRAAYFDAWPAYWEPWPPSRAGVESALRALGDVLVRRPLLGIGIVVAAAAWVRGQCRATRATGFGWGLVALAGFSLLPQAGRDVERNVLILLAPAYLLAVEAVWRGTRTRLGLVAALLLVVAQPARTWFPGAANPQTRTAQVKIGQWLGEHALPGTVVGARQVGALGYYSGLEMEDVEGQVSPRVAAARRALRPVNDVSTAHDFSPMLRQEPDLVLTGSREPVPSSILYVPDMEAVPEALRGEFGVYRWAANPVWRVAPGNFVPARNSRRAPALVVVPAH